MNLKNRYSEYKNSDIVWLGDIPKHWQIRRVKDLAEYQSGEYINANDFDDTNSYPVFGGNGFRGFADKYNHNGDYILIGRQGALCGNINYASGKFWATEHAVVVYKKKNVNIKWFGEFLRVMNLNQYALSAAQPGLSVDKVKRLELALPPLNEQNSIASFINHHTSIIDKRVSLLESKISAYKDLAKSVINEAVCKGLNKNVPLKDSSIEWVGEIPKHWEIKRIKDKFYTISGGTPSTKEMKFWNGNIPWIPSGKVQNNRIHFSEVEDFISDEALRNSSTKMAKANSILIALTGATCSNIGHLTFNTTINQSIVAIYPKSKNTDQRFLFHYLIAAKEKIRTYMTGGAQGGINQEDVKLLMVLIPPIEDQIAIAEYLDKKTKTIDAIVANIKLQIDSLKELRKTLINDVVTGKLKVTE